MIIASWCPASDPRLLEDQETGSLCSQGRQRCLSCLFLSLGECLCFLCGLSSKCYCLYERPQLYIRSLCLKLSVIRANKRYLTSSSIMLINCVYYTYTDIKKEIFGMTTLGIF